MRSIKGSSELIAKNYSRLPSNLEEGFNNKIRVFVESVGQSFDEYLVHPALLIMIAKSMGFEWLMYLKLLQI